MTQDKDPSERPKTVSDEPSSSRAAKGQKNERASSRATRDKSAGATAETGSGSAKPAAEAARDERRAFADVAAAKSGNAAASSTDSPSKPENSAATAPRASASADPSPEAGGRGGRLGGDRGREPREPRQRGGKAALIVAIIALVIALVALGGVAWLTKTGMEHLDQSGQRVTTVQKAQNKLAQRLDQKIAPRLSKLSKQVAKRDDALAAIRQKMAAIRKRNDRLADQLQGSTRHWQLQSIQSLLMAANRQVQLERDPQTAINALQLADRRLARLSDPSLFKLRKTIATEISKLKALPDPDIEGIALQLGEAADHVDKLPLASNVPERFVKQQKPANNGSGGAQPNAAGEKASSGWLDSLAAGGKRAADSVGSALSNMVTLRRSDSPPPMMLPPARAAYLAQNLALKMQTARQALLNNQPRLYRSSLNEARDWLERYFATDNARVANMIDRLKKLASAPVSAEMPDISASANVIRQVIEKEQAATRESGGNDSGATSGGSAAQGPQPAGSS